MFVFASLMHLKGNILVPNAGTLAVYKLPEKMWRFPTNHECICHVPGMLSKETFFFLSSLYETCFLHLFSVTFKIIWVEFIND